MIEVFSQMRSKDSRFTLGVWGLSVCSLDVAFMFATGPYGRAACGKFCKRGHFWRFHMWCCFSFRVAGVAFRDIQTISDVFCDVSKAHFVWQAQYFYDVFVR